MGAPTIRVSKLGYVGFKTPDLERLVEYYTKVLDFALVDGAPEGAFLTTGTDHHCVVVTRGDTRARAVVGYEIWEDLDSAQQRLKEAGYETQRRSDIGPGTPDVLVLDEPGTGIPLHLMTAQDPSGVARLPAAAPDQARPRRRVHPGLDPMQAFYQDLLGFRWSDTVGDFFVFLRCNADHHAANFMASTKVPGDAPHRLRDARPQPPHRDARPPGQARLPAALGPGPARPRPQPVHLPPRPRRATSSSCSPRST